MNYPDLKNIWSDFGKKPWKTIILVLILIAVPLALARYFPKEDIKIHQKGDGNVAIGKVENSQVDIDINRAIGSPNG
jgi:hypothetical protein